MDKNQIIDLIKNMKSIVGILSTSQPIKFGKTKSGKPQTIRSKEEIFLLPL